MQIASDELAHVAFLRSALGTSAAPQPLIDIGTSFAAAANAAFGATLSVNFTGYGSDKLFLLSAFIFEDVGVTAYNVRMNQGVSVMECGRHLRAVSLIAKYWVCHALIIHSGQHKTVAYNGW